MPNPETTLTETELQEIEALEPKSFWSFQGNFEGQFVPLVVVRRDTLCRSLRAAWAEIAKLTAQWCECGHAKDQHGFLSDHDECYQCDQASPDLCCEWRPAPRPNEHKILRQQLATQAESITYFQENEKKLKAQLAQAEKVLKGCGWTRREIDL